MATPSSSASVIIFSISVTQKLTQENFLVWRTQVLLVVRATRLAGILDGTTAVPAPMIQVERKVDKTKEEVQNPAYVQWITGPTIV